MTVNNLVKGFNTIVWICIKDHSELWKTIEFVLINMSNQQFKCCKTKVKNETN